MDTDQGLEESSISSGPRILIAMPRYNNFTHGTDWLEGKGYTLNKSERDNEEKCSCHSLLLRVTWAT
jgi:hypothetical protein